MDWNGIAPTGFWRVLGGSPQLSLVEKERIVKQLPSLPAEGLEQLYDKLKRAEARLRQTCREPEVVTRLYQALSGGDMADVYDWENALAISYRYGFSSLPFVAISSKAYEHVSSERLSAEGANLAEAALRAMTEERGVECSAWIGLGNLLQDHLKRYGEAEQAYRRAIELDPNYPSPWNGRGTLLKHLECYDEAEQAYRRAIELDPHDAYPQTNLARLLESLPGRDREAAACYLRAFEIDGSRTWDLEGFLRVGERLIVSGADLSEILKLAQKARQLAPDDTDTQFLIARILTLTGKWPEASQILETIAGKESAGFSIPFFKTVVEMGHLDDAIAILERTGAKEWWRPIYEALRAARAGTPDQLRTVAPEIRTVASRILRDIAPGLFQEKP